MELSGEWHMSPILSAKIEEEFVSNERLWQPLDIGSVFMSIFYLKKSQYFQPKE